MTEIPLEKDRRVLRDADRRCTYVM